MAFAALVRLGVFARDVLLEERDAAALTISAASGRAILMGGALVAIEAR